MRLYFSSIKINERNDYIFEKMERFKRILLYFDWYDSRIHLGIVKVARHFNWSLFCLSNSNHAKFGPAYWYGDGAITLLGSEDSAELFRRLSIPVVDLGLRKHDLKIPRVVVDNQEVGRMAAEHFLERGFTNFYVPFHHDIPFYRERYEAFRRALKELAGYDCAFITDKEMDNRFLLSRPLAGWRDKLRQLRLPAAIYAYQDSLAAEWVELCLLLGLRIPEEVAVLGTDNDRLICEALSCSVSSIETDLEGLGRRAAEVLHELLEGRRALRQEFILHPPGAVVSRESTDTITSPVPFIRDALQLMHEDPWLNAAGVANRLGVSQQTLQNMFRKHFFRSPAQTIRHIRLRRFKALLMMPDLPLSVIARRTGFSSVAAAYQFFKRETGQTPAQFRQYSNPNG